MRVKVTEEVFRMLSGDLKNAFSIEYTKAVKDIDEKFHEILNEMNDYTEGSYIDSHSTHFLDTPFLEYHLYLGRGYGIANFSFSGPHVIGSILLNGVKITINESDQTDAFNDIQLLMKRIDIHFCKFAYKHQVTPGQAKKCLDFRSVRSSNPFKLSKKDVKQCTQQFRARWQTDKFVSASDDHYYSVERGLFFQKSTEGLKFTSELRYNTDFYELSSDFDLKEEYQILQCIFGNFLKEISECQKAIQIIILEKRNFVSNACKNLLRVMPHWLCPRAPVMKQSLQNFLSFPCAALMHNKIILSWKWIPHQLSELSIRSYCFASVDLRWTWSVNNESPKVNIIPTFVDQETVTMSGKIRNLRGIEVNIHVDVASLSLALKEEIDKEILNGTREALTCNNVADLLITVCNFASNKIDAISENDDRFLYDALPGLLQEGAVAFDTGQGTFIIGKPYCISGKREFDFSWKGLTGSI